MRKVPGCTLRAYADDTALVHKNIWSVVGKLQDIFYEYERISGLALNIRKTVLVPLTFFDPARARALLVEHAPLWGALDIDSKAKYLRLVIGPGRGTASWTAPSQKFLDRATLWGKLGLGLLHSVEAYQVFVASVMMFVAQLDPHPSRRPCT